MTRRCIRLLLIVMLGALPGACSQPFDLKDLPRILVPEPDASPEQPSEDASPPAGEQTAGREENAPAQEEKPPGAEPQAQEPGTSEPVQADEGAGAQTDDEVVAVLDRRLEATLSEYDEQILEEFEKAQAERQAREQPPVGGQEIEAGPEDGTGGDPGQGPEKQAGPLAKADSKPSSPKTGGSPDNERESRQGSPGKKSHSVTPTDIPSGDDDDVVARQLREAAQKEPDPVLREKLWEEYRKYKKQQASVNTPPSTVDH